MPPDLLRIPQFVAANVVTLLVYAALGVLFVLLVLHLQEVAGFGPLLAGTALLPVTLLMIALSARAGALSQRIGPRLPMTAGPALSAVGVLLMLRIGSGASYLTDVLPAVTVFGAGLSLTVAPFDRHRARGLRPRVPDRGRDRGRVAGRGGGAGRTSDKVWRARSDCPDRPMNGELGSTR